MKRIKSIIALTMAGCFILTACSENSFKSEYGVYISDSYDELPKNVGCKTLVIDAQDYSKDEIQKLKENNDEIYSYLNVGSIETFRDYFKDYSNLTLGHYANWDEEYWVDVSDRRWQDFIVNKLAVELADKGVDGFFIDNTDVYYNYPDDYIYAGLADILQSLKASGKKIIINGGDYFVTKYLNNNGTVDPILDGVNQESVYTSINWEDNTFEASDSDTRNYYIKYLSSILAQDKDVYVLEYATDKKLEMEAEDLSNELGFKIYISDSIELD